MVDGLYQGPTATTLDFITVVRRIKLLGFNTIRLPFSMQALGLPHVPVGTQCSCSPPAYHRQPPCPATHASSQAFDVLHRTSLTCCLHACMQDLFLKKPLDWTVNCPYSGANPTSQKILNSVKKPGLKSKLCGYLCTCCSQGAAYTQECIANSGPCLL